MLADLGMLAALVAAIYLVAFLLNPPNRRSKMPAPDPAAPAPDPIERVLACAAEVEVITDEEEAAAREAVRALRSRLLAAEAEIARLTHGMYRVCQKHDLYGPKRAGCSACNAESALSAAEARADAAEARLHHECEGCPGCSSNDCPDALDIARHRADAAWSEAVEAAAQVVDESAAEWPPGSNAGYALRSCAKDVRALPAPGEGEKP